MKKFLTNKWFYIPAALVLVIIVSSLLKKNADTYEYITVGLSDVRQEVTVTGKVKPAESVALSFERSGRISSVPVEVGDVVAAGQSLLRLDTTDEYLDLKQAESSFAAAKAKLLELERGTRLEDVAILESKISAAQIDVAQSRQKLFDSLQSAYVDADDAVRNYADQFFDNARSTSPQLSIQSSDAQLEVDLEASRSEVEEALIAWKNGSSLLSVNSDLLAFTELSRARLENIRNMLGKLSLVVNALMPDQNLSQTTVNTYRSNVSTARSNIGAALASLTTNEDTFEAALSALDLAQKNLDLAKAGTVPEQILAQEAQVASEQAKIDSIRHRIAVSILYAPFAGTVTKQDGKRGEVVAANRELVSVISEGDLLIEAYVPEVDIGAITVGNETEVTFDAFSGETFASSIAYIDPAETVIDGVPTYKIKLALTQKDARIRPGMTANLSVKVAERLQVLSVPYRAVSGKNGDRYVSIQNAQGKIAEIPIELGIRGVNGEVEILSGLSEGDVVAIPIKK